MLKKLVLAAVGIALAAPAFAGNRQRVVVVQERYVVHRPVVVQRVRYYRPAPRPAVVLRNDAVPLLFGAIVGAAVIHSVLSH